MRFLRALLLCVLCCSVTLTLSSCALFGPDTSTVKKKKTKRPKNTKPDIISESKDPLYNQQDYVLNLSLAKLALSPSPEEGKANAAPYMEILHSYAAQPASPAAPLSIIAMEYKEKGARATQWVLVPLHPGGETIDTAALTRVMERMKGLPHVVHNIRPLIIAPTVPDAAVFSTEPPSTLREGLNRQLLQMMQRMQALPPEQDAAVQLELTRYFMEQKSRDAAYLSLENAKQILAKLSQRKDKPEPVTRLTSDMERLEDQLRRTLPFTL